MPIRDEIIVTRFADITITMHYHPALGMFKQHETELHAPHFFAVSDNDKDGVIIDIENCCVASFNSYKTFPRDKLIIILEWCKKHKHALLHNWKLAKSKAPIGQLPPPFAKRYS